MSISIITPHFNDFNGIQKTHECLKKQNSNQWEWVIVDDFSSEKVRNRIKVYFKKQDCSNIQLILNETKTNASACRNIGIEKANYNKLVFLDADDIISEDFVGNRNIKVEDFVVFKNFNLLDEKGNNKPSPTASSNYLDHFLKAKFIWQTTTVLWNKDFLIKIGKFNPDLKCLEDIELSIRALILSKNYKIIDNKVDFFYCVSPIDIKKRPVDIICGAVDYLISYMYDHYQLDKRQRDLVTGYYFLCIRYFNRSDKKKDIVHVEDSLKLFYQKKYMSYFSYLRGLTFLKLYKIHIISSDLFIRLNRYFYK